MWAAASQLEIKKMEIWQPCGLSTRHSTLEVWNDLRVNGLQEEEDGGEQNWCLVAVWPSHLLVFRVSNIDKGTRPPINGDLAPRQNAHGAIDLVDGPVFNMFICHSLQTISPSAIVGRGSTHETHIPSNV